MLLALLAAVLGREGVDEALEVTVRVISLWH